MRVGTGLKTEKNQTVALPERVTTCLLSLDSDQKVFTHFYCAFSCLILYLFFTLPNRFKFGKRKTNSSKCVG